ncbi:hypothetical protein EYF80_018226 [Liparis tanakae]|uniref:Uncharacterized protein n=1 Tax=Liparis tanakae TaxID=230148 RepID=A0A4Z2I159_9TELE|nr:hypothetical protein EYF80_018226 [Liparis tanakae]
MSAASLIFRSRRAAELSQYPPVGLFAELAPAHVVDGTLAELTTRSDEASSMPLELLAMQV